MAQQNRIACSSAAARDSGAIPGREDALEEGYPVQRACLENPWAEEPGGLQSTGSQSDRTEAT